MHTDEKTEAKAKTTGSRVKPHRDDGLQRRAKAKITGSRVTPHRDDGATNYDRQKAKPLDRG